MPKDVSNHHVGSGRNRYQAYKHPSRSGKGLNVIEEDAAENSSAKAEWEDATCPICMEFPHNAVLLLCASHDKGCRPYMCNTSYRHSNCLDQYQKAQLRAQGNHALRELTPEGGQVIGRLSGITSTDSMRTSRRSGRGVALNAIAVETAGTEGFETEAGLMERADGIDDSEQLRAFSPYLQGDVQGLLCPLCRGKVEGWKVIQSARDHWNHKVRSCAQEACPFSGNYEELRVHARREHPLARPSEVDPNRQRDWRRLERRRDLGDVMSTMLPGATVVGDFMIEDNLEDEEEAMDFPGDEGHLWTVFLLFQVFGPATSVESSSRLRSRLRVPRRGLWGESLARSESRQVDGSSEDSDPAELSRRSTRRRRTRRAEG
ncbi:hypothetical protein GOP47_0001042 [Adiantum capillus-veneris]|uniref:Zinc finger, RING/FYVE/PHD-type n=1 Tax=Adiantum capillus-veneris TaxID=13818 RepID=A0A9D4VG44_ADICA|nr:hypothetical protein GOP47_0000898 [Adiantum capillus-veneris]KAI5084873.1 hypothetical protein GOP47_0001042 [Adiantum capillus-veneris]